ncbi:MAG TPA: nucleotidyltransferase family protein [Bryobacteraceae bacterium]|nr:nucleotidyltransferase family protein [Bryobacteraceae bacterium]
MSTVEILRNRKLEIEAIARKHGALNVRVFGSVAREEDSSASDIDFLIDVVGKTTSWFPSGMALELQDLLGRPVDVLTERALHPVLRERVLREAIPL